MEPLTVLLILIFFAIGFIAGDQGSRVWNKLKASNAEASIDPDAKIVLRVWKNEQSGDMTVELEGKSLKNFNFVNYRQRETFIALLEDLFLWAGRPFPKQSTEGTAPEAALTSGRAVEAISERTTVTPAASQKPAESPTKPVRASPMNLLARALDSEVGKIPLEFKSIAGQIDDILQEKLVGTPLEKRGIHLVELPDQGVGVTIGLEKYEGIDSVPDEEVRSLIREAVSEWEKRTRPS